MINNPDIGAIAYTRLLGIPRSAENTFCALKASLKPPMVITKIEKIGFIKTSPYQLW